MGFSYASLNGTTGIDGAASGWVSSDGHWDTSLDTTQTFTAISVPANFIMTKTDGPEAQVLSTIKEASTIPLWLIEVSLLPVSREIAWTAGDGRTLAGVVGIVAKTFASSDFYQTQGGPVWTLSSTQAEMLVGEVRVRILRSDTDASIGSGSVVIVSVD